MSNSNMLAGMEDFRPGNLTRGAKLCGESDVEVENIQILHPIMKNKENALVVFCYVAA